MDGWNRKEYEEGAGGRGGIRIKKEVNKMIQIK